MLNRFLIWLDSFVVYRRKVQFLRDRGWVRRYHPCDKKKEELIWCDGEFYRIGDKRVREYSFECLNNMIAKYDGLGRSV
jgi:hypothetical protein